MHRLVLTQVGERKPSITSLPGYPDADKRYCQVSTQTSTLLDSTDAKLPRSTSTTSWDVNGTSLATTNLASTPAMQILANPCEQYFRLLQSTDTVTHYIFALLGASTDRKTDPSLPGDKVRSLPLDRILIQLLRTAVVNRPSSQQRTLRSNEWLLDTRSGERRCSSLIVACALECS